MTPRYRVIRSHALGNDPRAITRLYGDYLTLQEAEEKLFEHMEDSLTTMVWKIIDLETKQVIEWHTGQRYL